MNWMKLHFEARTDAKLRSLPDDQFRTWFELLLFAGEHGGATPPMKARFLAMEVASGNIERLLRTLERLLDLEIITGDPESGVRFINFVKRQARTQEDLKDAAARRQQAKRDKDRGVTSGHGSSRAVTHVTKGRKKSRFIEEKRGEENRVERHDLALEASATIPAEEDELPFTQLDDELGEWPDDENAPEGDRVLGDESVSPPPCSAPPPPSPRRAQPAPKPGAYLYRFEEWYARYPRKRSRTDAEKAWAKLRPDDALVDAMIAAVEKQRAWTDWSEADGKYIPYPASWLNGKMWTDEDPGQAKPLAAVPLRAPSDEAWRNLLKGQGETIDREWCRIQARRATRQGAVVDEFEAAAMCDRVGLDETLKHIWGAWMAFQDGKQETDGRAS